jgi:hypothetical protein
MVCTIVSAQALPVVLPEIDDEERRRVLAMRRAVTATAASLRQLKASVVDCSGKVKAAFRSAAGASPPAQWTYCLMVLL